MCSLMCLYSSFPKRYHYRRRVSNRVVDAGLWVVWEGQGGFLIYVTLDLGLVLAVRHPWCSG